MFITGVFGSIQNRDKASRLFIDPAHILAMHVNLGEKRLTLTVSKLIAEAKGLSTNTVFAGLDESEVNEDYARDYGFICIAKEEKGYYEFVNANEIVMAEMCDDGFVDVILFKDGTKYRPIGDSEDEVFMQELQMFHEELEDMSMLPVE